MSDQLYGVVNGLYYCNIDKDNELNQRLAERNVPSGPLQPQFSMRPVSTKYALMPIVDRRPKPTVEVQSFPNYSVGTTFNPGDSQGPWSGFASNVDVDSTLRNQFFALQKCEQPNFIPSSDSDMYHVTAVGRQEEQQCPGLFKEERFSDFNPNTCDVGKDIWGNNTRVQLRGSECCKENKC